MRDIENYEGLYAITRDGKVWSHRTKKFLSPGKRKDGYLQVGLYKDGKRKNVYIHKLVAEAFLENPENLPFVNHKDECKTNNNVKNLEYCTPKYNCNYGTRNKRITEKNCRKVYCFETEKIYNSYSEAAKELGLYQSEISRICNGERKASKGYHFYRIQECD